jgi:glycosyltransferase involved in cell wall biosynthesis
LGTHDDAGNAYRGDGKYSMQVRASVSISIIMKIVHIESGRHLYGGPQQVKFLVSGLAERDVENILVCPPGAALGRQLRTLARVIEIPCAGDLDVAYFWHLYYCLRKEMPDLVHVHSRRGADWWGGLAARLAGVPAVLSRRVDRPEGRLTGMKYRLYRRVIAISRAVREQLLEAGVAGSAIAYVPSGVQAEALQIERDRQWLNAEMGVPRDAFLLGIVAQLIPRKGHSDLFRALWSLEDAGCWLLVLGQGKEESRLREEARRRGLSGQIVFAGFREDAARILPCLDVLVHPAHREGLGVSVLEAAAEGVPIIATNAGGLVDLIIHGDTGLLVSPGAPDELAEAIALLRDNRELGRQLANAARRKVTAEFTVESMIEGTFTVYEKVLGNPGER